ncbi:M48 family metallopeptidase [Aurantiacibacter hainanensis]|uniref:M48 family metallopeptidase n=1 Tax=Aurantiacibacter hainanensis TaxID=3076114 RepID=UPI0030C65E95
MRSTAKRWAEEGPLIELARLPALALLAAVSLALAPGAVAQTSAELAEQDLRLARIADAMLLANAGLCRQTMPVTGMILHSADQYGEEALPLFANGPLSVAGVVPGSAAQLAGVQAGDGVVAINDRPIDAISPEGEDNLREAAFFLLADLPPGEPIILELRRGDGQETVQIEPERGCRSLVEILLADGPNARSDGRVIQLQFEFARDLADEQVAVVLAHEFAHTVLEHRRRKVEAGIDNASLLRHVGRNQRVNREAEIEADRLSVHLLANAGYDPALIAEFWRSPEGQQAGGGALPSFIYPTQSARAELVETEIDRYLSLRRGPSWPGHLIELRERDFASD